MKSAISDKKIFYGLVTLIVLTILLIVGISFIQRPQTTSSDAQFQEPLTQQITQDGQVEEPTSIPLLPDEGNQITDDGPLQQQIEQTQQDQTTTTEEVPVSEGDTQTTTPESGTDETTTTVNDPLTTGEEETTTTTTATATPTPDATNPDTTTEESSGTETPTPTDVLLASGNDEDSISTSGGLTEDLEPTYDYGGGTTETEIAYSTSTPVPTAADQLPVAGAAHVTVLLLGASLMLVLLGFILT